MEESTKSLRRFLEVSANLGIIIVALIVIGNFVASKWRTKRVETLTTGSKVSLSGVKWEDGPTLVLALQRGCRFCEESTPFYRRLWQQRSSSEPRIIAVVPGDKGEISKYPGELGVAVNVIVNASLAVL